MMPNFKQNTPLFALKCALFDQKQPLFERYLYTFDELTVWVSPETLTEAISFLKKDPRFSFEQLIDVTAVDYPDREMRFEVVYHLLSHQTGLRLRVKTETAPETSVPSVVDLYPSACWWECEAWDMFGILFEGNPDHRRLLTDYGFEGHPLRKDFPVTGYYQVAYDDVQKKVVHQPVALQQEFREYDFESPWEGIGQLFDKDKPAGDEDGAGEKEHG